MFYEDSKKIGIGLILIGLFLYSIGIMFFLDRGLLAMGNLSFLMGVIALVGVKNAFMFFGKKSKILGSQNNLLYGSLSQFVFIFILCVSVFFFSGFLLIVIGWYTFTLVGFSMQMYGLFMLFRQFVSTIFSYSQTLPIIGPILRTSPFIQKVVEKISDSSNGGAKKRPKYEV